MNNRISFENNAFDVISFVAAFNVMIAHTCAYVLGGGYGSNLALWRIIAPGPAVAVIFAVSGFLVAASYERCQHPTTFYVKRAFRIYPALLIVIMLPTLIYLCLGIVNFSWKNLALFLVKNFLTASGGSIFLPENAIGNGSLWTIPIQIQFYILTPFMYKFMKKNKGKHSVIVLVILTAINLISPLLEGRIPHLIRRVYSLTCLPYLYMYFFGMLVYYYFGRVVPWLSKWSLVIGCLYIVVHWVLGIDTLCEWKYINPISCFLIMSFAIGIAYRIGRFRLPFDISYGMYLWHLPVIDLLYIVCKIDYSIGFFLIARFITLIIAGISWTIIERPFIRVGTKLCKKQ